VIPKLWLSGVKSTDDRAKSHTAAASRPIEAPGLSVRKTPPSVAENIEVLLTPS